MTSSLADQSLDQLSINTLRLLAVDAVEKAKSGHPGAPLGCAPIAYLLFHKLMKHNPSHSKWADRDRFVLSNGHASMLLYGTLFLTGYDMTLDDLKGFRQWGSRTPGHPEYGHTDGVEATTGPLGQGIAMAVGMAIAEKHLAAVYNRPGFAVVDHHTFALLGDGDLMEGVSHEAASLAGTLGLGKLIFIYDDNLISLDGPTTRRMLQLAEDAAKKNLKVGVGLMCRHCKARWELYDRIKQGQIGELTTLRSYRLVGPVGFTGPKPKQMSELLYQIQKYLGFMWASGGVFHDFVAHNVDECCWMKDAWPVRADGMGSRCYRGDAVDQNFDHYSVEYTFAEGAKLFLSSRYMSGCREEFASYVHGTKGSAVISTFMHTPAKCRIFKGQTVTRADMTWAFPQPEPNPYELEWDDLVEAIRQDKPYNEVKRGAEAALVVAMGRKAVHTGQAVTFEEMLNDGHEFAPEVDKFTMNSPAPVQLGPDGLYPAPQPGRLKGREYSQ